jgi:tellurite methyltransferase
MTSSDSSIRFFDEQFQRQAGAGEFELNPFERLALAQLRGDVLDAGCGLGNLALAAAERGCRVLALDASPCAIERLAALASARALPLRAERVDLRHHLPAPSAFDAVICIGLLPYFDCATAGRQLQRLRAAVRPGGIAAVNVLIVGTTWRAAFGDDPYCLFEADALRRAFDGWTLLHDSEQAFDAPDGSVKRFSTVIAQAPTGPGP